MPKIYDMGPTAILPLRRKAEWGFFALKIRRLRPGLNPRTWVLKASMLLLDYRSRNIYIYKYIYIYTWLHLRCNASFPVALWPYSGSWPPLTELHDHTHGHTTLCRAPLVEWRTRRRDLYPTTQYATTVRHPCPSAGFEPANPASELLQTQALDRAAAGIGRR